MEHRDARPGMRVVFGRPGPQAEKSLGEIVKCNPARARVKLLEERGTRGQYAPGMVFNVPYGLMEPEPAGVVKGAAQADRPAADAGTPIVAGVTTFRSAYADSNPLWRVIRKSGPESYVCRVEEEPVTIGGQTYPGDWDGTEKAFLTRDILRSVRSAALYDRLESAHTTFYAQMKPGQTYHYHNGFGQYVRCVVVSEGGENRLKPVALVGSWDARDLPRRLADGSVVMGHYPQRIADGESFTPNYSNVYETGQVNHPDPRHLPAIDLAVPELTPEEATAAAKWTKVHAVHAVTGGDLGDPDVILAEVAALLRGE